MEPDFRERERLGLPTGSSQVSSERTRVCNGTPDTSFGGCGWTARRARAVTTLGRRNWRGRCTARSASGAGPRGHALWAHGWSAKRRMTRPEAGFGVKSVDLRGMRAPAAATAATASTGVGRRSTAVPSVRRASATASSTLCAYPTASAVSGRCQTWPTRARCSTVTSRSARAAGSSASSTPATRPAAGLLTNQVRSPSVRTAANPGTREAASSAARGVSISWTAQAARAESTAVASGTPTSTRWIAWTCGP